VETFYQHRLDEVALVPVFAAFVPPDASVRLGSEHDRYEWLPVAAAGHRFAWPRERRALEDAIILLRSGSAGPVDDVLRVC
jgi:dihydroneopterin triphosphate diphosphatase